VSVTPSASERLLRATEVAEILSLGRSKVYEMLATGELPTVRIGTAVRVPANKLQEWIAKRIESKAA
jgi:excisionase family DNA binding protein